MLYATIVLPCYLPNEEEILPFVLDHYMKKYEKLAKWEIRGKCKNEVRVVYKSPNQHPNFAPVIKDLQQTYEAKGFQLAVRENKETVLDWTCIVRDSEHTCAMNLHCLYDRNGTPDDENERHCQPYGMLITIGDATKPLLSRMLRSMDVEVSGELHL